jgi:hypothetical protein
MILPTTEEEVQAVMARQQEVDLDGGERRSERG